MPENVLSWIQRSRRPIPDVTHTTLGLTITPIGRKFCRTYLDRRQPPEKTDMTATVRPYDAKSKRRTCAHFTATFLLLALLTVTSTVASASASADASTQRRHLRHSHHVSRHMARSAPGNTLASGARIIGGRTVENPLERFPYFVALRDDQDLHFCGGTLIAPDIVLTAAHCFGTLATALIGGSTDHVISLQHQIPHPSFIRDALSYDQMVIKLAEPAVNDDGTSPTVLINLDDTVPESIPSDKRLEIAIIGFGQTATVQELIANPSASLSVSSTLQKTIVDHVPNEGCATHQKDDIDYGDLIKDDMICAWGNETGQCHGDSGGPYLLLGNDNDPAQDVQIGIVSWGVGCANQAFPSVASRTSATTFIRQATCEYSSQPPDYFECDQFDSPSPTMAPTSPTISPAPTVQLVPLNLTLHLDGSPEDTHWEIWDETETVLYAARSSGSYNASALVHTGWRVTETVWLHRGNNYTFVIYDVSKNGVSRWGTVYEIDAPMNEKHDHKILLQGEGLFLEQAKNPFHVPSSEEEMAQAQVNSRLSSLPAAYATVYLDIQFDAWPSETGWAIVSASNRSSIFAMAPPGTYRDGINITETINLPYSSTDPKENEYALIVVDHYGDGILQGGSYRLWIPHQSNATTLISTPGELTLAEGLGKHLKQEALHNFTLPDVLASEVLN